MQQTAHYVMQSSCCWQLQAGVHLDKQAVFDRRIRASDDKDEHGNKHKKRKEKKRSKNKKRHKSKARPDAIAAAATAASDMDEDDLALQQALALSMAEACAGAAEEAGLEAAAAPSSHHAADNQPADLPQYVQISWVCKMG